MWNCQRSYLCNIIEFQKNKLSSDSTNDSDINTHRFGRHSFMCTTLLYDLLPININFIYFGLFWSVRIQKVFRIIIFDLVIYRHQSSAKRSTKEGNKLNFQAHEYFAKLFSRSLNSNLWFFHARQQIKMNTKLFVDDENWSCYNFAHKFLLKIPKRIKTEIKDVWKFASIYVYLDTIVNNNGDIEFKATSLSLCDWGNLVKR